MNELFQTFKIFVQTNHPHIINYSMITIGIISFIIAVLGFIYYFHDKNKEALTGEIKAYDIADIKYLAVGASIRMKVETPDGVLFKDGNEPLISLGLNQNVLTISIVIRDMMGDIVAEMINNEWQINKNNMFDRNYNQKAVEVRDNKGNVIIQAAHFGDTIFFAGTFYCKNGRKVAIIPLDNGEAIMKFVPPGDNLEQHPKPLFNYPSEKHLGECNKLDTLEQKLKSSTFTVYNFKTALDICGTEKLTDAISK